MINIINQREILAQTEKSVQRMSRVRYEPKVVREDKHINKMQIVSST